MEKKKIFISLPMSGKRKREILEDRDAIVKHLHHYGITDIEVLDTYIDDEPPENSNIRLWYLGKTIELLAQADLVVFAQDWAKARGCRVEYECARIYHIPSIVISSNEMIEVME